MSVNVVEARGLGKRYGRTWALRECTLAVPAGHVAALAGPNGAGKTTLLNLAVGLAAPSAGAVTVLGGRPAGSPAALGGIARQSVLSQVLQGAPQLAGKGGIPQSPDVTQYLIQHGYAQWTSYQPGSRFWPFQWIEGGWLFALSVLLIAATIWLVRRRAA